MRTFLQGSNKRKRKKGERNHEQEMNGLMENLLFCIRGLFDILLIWCNCWLVGEVVGWLVVCLRQMPRSYKSTLNIPLQYVTKFGLRLVI